jgi:hypothetical protein
MASPKAVVGKVDVAVLGASGLSERATGKEVFAIVGVADKLLWQSKKAQVCGGRESVDCMARES